MAGVLGEALPRRSGQRQRFQSMNSHSSKACVGVHGLVTRKNKTVNRFLTPWYRSYTRDNLMGIRFVQRGACAQPFDLLIFSYRIASGTWGSGLGERSETTRVCRFA